jgi:hypothetical protein
MIRRSLLSSAALLGVTFGIAPIAVQADNARDWQNLPTDLNMIFGYYNRIDTNTPIDISMPFYGLRENGRRFSDRIPLINPFNSLRNIFALHTVEPKRE